MQELKTGERVLVKPTHPSEYVQRAAGMYGQFLKPDWQEVVLDSFLLARCLDGSLFVQPVPEPQTTLVAKSEVASLVPLSLSKEED